MAYHISAVNFGVLRESFHFSETKLQHMYMNLFFRTKNQFKWIIYGKMILPVSLVKQGVQIISNNTEILSISMFQSFDLNL